MLLVDPVRVHLRLAQRLLQVGPQPVRVQRPGADDGLQDQIRLVRIAPPVDSLPHDLLPGGGLGGDAGEAGTNVSASLRVVGRRREQAARRARQVRLVEILDGKREPAGIATHLVQRDEAVPAVERRVLHALGVHGRRRLLEPDDESVVPALLEQEDPCELLGQTRVLDRGAVVPGHERRIGLDIRAVDVERGERRGDVGVERELGGQLRRLFLEGRRRLLELRLSRHGGERPPLAGQLLVQLRERRLTGRVDEERSDVVQELVPGRPFDRPLRSQPLARLQDLLDPGSFDPGLTQPLEVPARVREAVRMIHAHAVDQPRLRELDDLRVRHLPDLGILHPHACEPTDVEEAPVQAGAPVEVEELRTPERVAPEGILVTRRHVVRDDVQHDAETGRAELAEVVLAAQILGDARRIDDVVAVRRAGVGLERRREVEVGDAEVAQVRDELLRLAKAQPRSQLEPVGRARRRHLNRRGEGRRASAPRPARRRAPGARRSPPRARARPSRARASSGGRRRRPAA